MASSKSTSCVAFLRGINVGGHKPIKMQDLKRAFESLGLKNVKTILASGNVVFDQPGRTDPTGKIESRLKQAFNVDIGVVVRDMQELKKLAEAEPFKGIRVTPQTRLYVTFLSEHPKKMPKAPFQPSGKNYIIAGVSGREVLSVVNLSGDTQTTDLMGFLDKEFGRSVTTRNWNTIARILKSDQ